MPVCPLCESTQPAGDACDVCGRPFPAGERSAPPVAAIPELEPTHHAPVPEPRDAVEDLEPNAAPPVAAVEAPPVEGLEATAHVAGPDLAAEPIDPVDLEPTAAEPVPDDGAPRGPIVCRYCRTPATGWERLCARCGMRLPVPRRAAGPAPVVRLCSDCGVPLAGSICRGCGARMPGG